MNAASSSGETNKETSGSTLWAEGQGTSACIKKMRRGKGSNPLPIALDGSRVLRLALPKLVRLLDPFLLQARVVGKGHAAQAPPLLLSYDKRMSERESY